MGRKGRGLEEYVASGHFRAFQLDLSVGWRGATLITGVGARA